MLRSVSNPCHKAQCVQEISRQDILSSLNSFPFGKAKVGAVGFADLKILGNIKNK